MTTMVRVINEGPRDVVVSTVNPATSEPTNSVVLKPGEVSKSGAHYLHDSAILAVVEASHV